MHRDIKPGNILLNSKGEVKIGDFGIAASLLEKGQRKRARYTTVGTPCYMAPEVLTPSAGYNEKADIWSLGIAAIELATGSGPYSNLRALEVVVRIANSPPPTLPDEGKYSPAFREFVRSCLQVAPAKRPSAAELLESKFFKQRASAAELSDRLLRLLPPLEQRFRLMHGPSLEGDPGDGPKQPTIWDFDGLDVDTPAATVPASPPPRVTEEPAPADAAKRVVGRFTITSAAAPAAPKPSPPPAVAREVAPPRPELPAPTRVQQLEAEVAELTARVQVIAAENTRLKDQMSTMEQALVRLRAAANKA
jgi:serine/threonine-protein kinase OSR1/STK39